VKDLKQTLLDLEKQLLTLAVRQDVQKLSVLLADEFREVGSSGRSYSKSEVLASLPLEAAASFSLDDFAVCPVSEEAILVTFRAVKEVAGSQPVASLRSSLWVQRDGRWQLLFHQGTALPSPER
jgi:hypothetical protein